MKINKTGYEVYIETSEGRRTYGATNIEAVCKILKLHLPSDLERSFIDHKFVTDVLEGRYKPAKRFGINHPFHIYGD